ncbi:MAG: hypothetical protein LC104_09765 [Bacteroidales bacterium]|nr:hypothetical protein [Bacteroidales bacterium]
MRPLVFRIVRNGVVTAFPLAMIGYLLAELAGFGLTTQPAFSQPRDAVAVEEISAQLRQRLPFTMAAWGVGLVTLWELLLFVVRGHPAPAPTPEEPTPHDDLYNQLLQHAETAAPASAGPRTTPAAPIAPTVPNTPRSTDAQP